MSKSLKLLIILLTILVALASIIFIPSLADFYYENPAGVEDSQMGGLAQVIAPHSLVVLEDSPPVYEITAYCHTGFENPEGIMASGLKVYKGAVACPRHIPLKTEIKINSQTFICEDRLHPRYDDRFDIYMSDCEQAREWGIRSLAVGR